MPTIRIAEPAVEPVTLAEAKLHCRVDHDAEDTLIGALITAARQMAEHELQRSLVSCTWEMRTDAFAPALRLDWPRVQAIVALQYLDVDRQLQTLDPLDYELDAASDCGPAWLVPAPGRAWPVEACAVNAVRVQYRAGYGDTPASVPASIRQWMLLHIGAMYAQREAVGKDLQPMPYLAGLLDPHRVYP